jgi:hypothetical protein
MIMISHNISIPFHYREHDSVRVSTLTLIMKILCMGVCIGK